MTAPGLSFAVRTYGEIVRRVDFVVVRSPDMVELVRSRESMRFNQKSRVEVANLMLSVSWL